MKNPIFADFWMSELGKLFEEIAGKQDEIIRNAFQKHFGFPITDVEDTENFRRIVSVDDPYEKFQYKGETFLYFDRTPRFEMKLDPNMSQSMTITNTYLEV